MRTGVVFLSVLISLAACAARRWSEGGDPRLWLRAEAYANELPATVHFQAFIEGGRDNEPALYCPDVIWDFQGAVFRSENDCPPYREDRRIQRAFTMDHTFETEGAYRVTVVLLQRGRTVLRASANLQVRHTGVRLNSSTPGSGHSSFR